MKHDLFEFKVDLGMWFLAVAVTITMTGLAIYNFVDPNLKIGYIAQWSIVMFQSGAALFNFHNAGRIWTRLTKHPLVWAYMAARAAEKEFKNIEKIWKETGFELGDEDHAKNIAIALFNLKINAGKFLKKPFAEQLHDTHHLAFALGVTVGHAARQDGITEVKGKLEEHITAFGSYFTIVKENAEKLVEKENPPLLALTIYE